jgi:thioredoxin reductase
MYRIMTGPSYAARYVRQAESVGVQIRTATMVTDWCSPTHLQATSPDGRLDIQADAVILATGCRERPRNARLIPGHRPAGIFTTGALQNFVYLHHYPVGKCALVVGADHVGFSAIMTLKDAGTDVVAMVTDFPHHQSYFAYQIISATRYRVPIWTDLQVSKIIGQKRVEAVELTHTVDGTTSLVECDTVVFTGDWIPDYELSHSGGLEFDTYSHSPKVDLDLHTSVEGVFAAGNLIHAAETADVAALSGRYAARSVQDYLQRKMWSHNRLIIEVDAPLLWVSPQMIAPEQSQTPHGHFILRVSEFLKRPLLEVWQGQRRLWQQRYWKMIPNLPVHVGDNWLKQVDRAGGNIQFRIVT